ncbi:MAG: thiamine diphosphokinase [Clostridia bacterium]|nr:thiamine diphosphokinase [Clostridia bacterium]
MDTKALFSSLPQSYHDPIPACIIVGAGDRMHQISPTPGKDDLVIAADGGYRYLRDAGIRCDLLMGDLDSLPRDTVIATETKRFDPVKDDTDTMLAVRHGLECGYRKFLLYGMFGGRFDHTLGTMQTVAFLTRAGAKGYAFEEAGDGKHASYVTALYNDTRTFSPDASGYLSLVAWGGEARDVTLQNLKYPFAGGTFDPDVALGISNEFLPGLPARVTVGDGLLLMVKPV